MWRVYIWRICHPRRYLAALFTHEDYTYAVKHKIDIERWKKGKGY